MTRQEKERIALKQFKALGFPDHARESFMKNFMSKPLWPGTAKELIQFYKQNNYSKQAAIKHMADWRVEDEKVKAVLKLWRD